MKHFYLLFTLFLSVSLYSQNTVGTITNEAGSYNGHTLFTPNNSTETYLINNCGEVVNQWTSRNPPGVAVYLLENGDLLRTAKIVNDSITFGGVGGRIDRYDWDNNLMWQFNYSSNEVAQHHDIFPLQNGNILMLVVTTMTKDEAIQAGRDPSLIIEGKLYNEQILELEPVGAVGANVVWEWNIKDHLIQDFDFLKDNFGVVADNEQLLDINYLNDNTGQANWLHANSMQYNATLDQIILSTRFLSEFYIIDHSTTTAQAATSSGGTYGKGGDILYRWGNPEAYDHGDNTNRTLWGQHYPHWIGDGLTDAGKIMIYNNGAARGYSSIDIIDPPASAPGIYTYDAVNGYGPTTAEWSYTKPVKEDFFSPILSSAQRLPNGNTLICAGFFGRFFEIDSNENIVWEYINPDTPAGILTQGNLSSFDQVFRALRFPTDYAAFVGRDLTPHGTIELGDDLGNCSILNTELFEIADLKIFPNPTIDILSIKTNEVINKIEVYDILGKLVVFNHNTKQIDLSHISRGLYILKIYSNNTAISKKIIKN